MFDNLTSKLQRVFKTLSGEGILTEANVGEALAQIRSALLEGDVHLGVADRVALR